MLTKAGMLLVKESSYVDHLNRASFRLVKRLGRTSYRLGNTIIGRGLPLAGRMGMAGIKGTGALLQAGADIAARRPAMTLSTVVMPGAYAWNKFGPGRLEALGDYTDPQSHTTAYRVGLLRNAIRWNHE